MLARLVACLFCALLLCLLRAAEDPCRSAFRREALLR